METNKKNKKNTAAPAKLPDAVIETAQDAVPIEAVHDKEGLISSYRGQYSRMYQISEINYSTLPEEEQEALFERWRAFLNSLGSETEAAVTIRNDALDRQSFEDSVLNKERGDQLDYLRDEMNSIIKSRVSEGKNGLQTDKYVTISVHAPNLQKAKELFRRIDSDINTSLSKLGSSAKPVPIEDRIDMIYDAYNPGHAGELLSRTRITDDDGVVRDESAFDFENIRSMGLSIKDILAPSSITYHTDYIELGDKFARVLTVSDYPSVLGDDFLTAITSISCSLICTLNVVPMSNAQADRLVNTNLSLVRAEKEKKQRKLMQDGASETLISPAILEREQEALQLRDDMHQHDEHLFTTNLTVIVYADDLAQLKEYSDTIISEARKRSVIMQPLTGLQDVGFAATLPLCYNGLKEHRTFKSSSVTALLPFSVTELSDASGINYSLNAVTKSLVLYDRKKQFNANGFILGTSGSGKSFAAKTEMLNVILRTDDDVIVIDPESEYEPLCEAVNGTTIKVVAGGNEIINPLDVVTGAGRQDGDPVLEKIDFMQSLFQSIVHSAWGIDSIQETIIDETLHQLYSPFYTTDHGVRELMPMPRDETPTLTDMYRLLAKRKEPEARTILYALQPYIEGGSMGIFGSRTNVDVDNRFVVYDINALGKKLKPVAMLIILDSIWNRIVHNRSIGRHTWFYVDEIYLLFKDQISSDWLSQAWKRFRKYGGVGTGISQNVDEILNSEAGRTMLANSSFVEMLNQAPTDREHLKDLLHLSESQCAYITDAPRGQGLIYTGSQTVPIFSRFPKDSSIYRFLTSDLMEIKHYREEAFRKQMNA